MKFWLPKFVLVLFGLWLFIKYLPAIPISSLVTQKQALFTVTGTGKVTVIPDTAIISAGVVSHAASVSLAQSQTNTVIKKITDSLGSLGLSSTDIKTSQYSVSPQYDYQTSPAKITGYQVEASLTITVKNLDKINSVIDSATAAGANQVGSLQLTVNDDRQKQLLQKAREEAISDAKSKAQSLASAAGLILGRVVNVEESTPSEPRPFLSLAAADKVGLGGAPTQIQPGSTDITSTVTLSYETR